MKTKSVKAYAGGQYPINQLDLRVSPRLPDQLADGTSFNRRRLWGQRL